MRFRHFMLATGLGQLPATIVYSWTGSLLTGGTFWLVTGLSILFALAIVVAVAKALYLEQQRGVHDEFTPSEVHSADSSPAGLAASPPLRRGAQPYPLVGAYSAGVLPGVDVRRLSGTQAFAPRSVLRSLVSARVAQLCLCEFCIDITNMKLAERSGGSDKLLAVAEWRDSALFSERERLALGMPKRPA